VYRLYRKLGGTIAHEMGEEARVHEAHSQHPAVARQKTRIAQGHTAPSSIEQENAICLT
jgi:hypothetical protein